MRMEILAPAGNREALERAQAAGADAVYLGYSAFSARAGAGNFDGEELREAIRFAHLHRMRVYVTVNTLIKDGELDEAAELLETLREIRADGVLIQDAGLLRIARRRVPRLRLHASTQMAIHNRSGVRWCRRMGIRRVVLARECGLEEIRQCAGEGPEIEVFGHGAQCVAVSGECLFSSMAGERSGNRGRCAQPCRKIYRFGGKKGAWLSPRDLCLRDDVPALAEAGAASLKIEGRLKRPEYVYTVTDSYRRAADGAEAGDFRPAGEAEKDALRQIFNRGGFMRGYAFGTEDAGVIQPEGVNHRGLRIGRVENAGGRLCRVRLERDLHDGDGLRLIHGQRETEITYAGPERPAGSAADVRLREGTAAAAGDEVYRLTDAKQLAAAMAAPLGRIPVRMALEAWPGKAIRLRVTDGRSEAEVFGGEAEPARTRETGAEEIRRQLEKTGGTDFTPAETDIRTGGAFVPLAEINRLRREALERLAEARRRDFEAETAGGEPGPETARQAGEVPGAREETAAGPAACPEILITVRTRDQAEAARRAGAAIAWYPEDYRPEAMARLARDMEPGEWLRLPEVCREETLAAIRGWADTWRDRLGGVLLGSIGQLGTRWPVPVAAGPGVPVMNREAARLMREEGCAFVFASPELTGRENLALRAAGEDMPGILTTVYGRTQLMLLHHCPARTALGLSRGHGACRLCDGGAAEALRGKTLEDEAGRSFPLLRVRLPEGCLVRLMNMLPTDLGGKGAEKPWAMEMTTESGAETEEILEKALRGEKTPGEATRGHWNRAVL